MPFILTLFLAKLLAHILQLDFLVSKFITAEVSLVL